MLFPRYNPDGVSYFQRDLASNLDPNREHTKLARRQSREIKRLLSSFSPHIAVDMHEFTGTRLTDGHYKHGSKNVRYVIAAAIRADDNSYSGCTDRAWQEPQYP